MARSFWLSALVGGGLAAALLAGSASAHADESAERWKVWREDLEYLYDQVEKPASLRQIFKVKGIDWKRVRKEVDVAFREASKQAKKRKKDDLLADQVAFYDVLNGLVARLQDGHAHVEVEAAVREAWQASQPVRHPVGIELMPGANDTVLVARVEARSPLGSRGVDHEATLLESINGVPAAKFFAERASQLLGNRGGLSTPGRAYLLALHTLELEEDEELEFVFQTLDAPEAALRKYLEKSPAQRKKALARLKWKSRKIKLRGRDCRGARNPWGFRFHFVEPPAVTATSAKEVFYGRLGSGYGYVQYTGVSQSANQGLAEACAALADCPGLILDVRRNGGGGDGGAAQVFDKKDGVWDKPVAVLIGPWAMSAAETELWELQRQRSNSRLDLRLFGRTTAGASGDKIRWELPSGFAKGRFVYRHWHGGRSTIEGAGIEPDEALDQDVVELALGFDSHIRAAEEWLDTACRQR